MYGPYQGGTARPYKMGIGQVWYGLYQVGKAWPYQLGKGRTKSGKGRTKSGKTWPYQLGKGRTRESKNAVSSCILLQSCRKQTNSQQYQILRIYQWNAHDFDNLEREFGTKSSQIIGQIRSDQIPPSLTFACPQAEIYSLLPGWTLNAS